MKKVLVLALTIGGLFGTTLTAASNGDNRSRQGVHFVKIRFDPNGPDDGSNRHLNREVVVIRNDSNRNVDVNGWTIHDLDKENVYRIRLRRHSTLYEGASMSLHSGNGVDSFSMCFEGCPASFGNYWGSDGYVWDNDRDRATLMKRDGRVADRCGYGRRANRFKDCG